MTNNVEDTSRQAESLWRSDDWADLRWAREHSTPQQTARHLLDPQWRNRDYNALDELVEMTHDADLASLSEDDLETLAASSLPELRQSVIRYKDTPARLLEDMARTESNTRLLQMLVESGKLGQNTIDLCCWNQTDSRLAASMLPKASDHLLVRLSGRDWWPSRKNAVESGRLDRARLSEMIEKENHPDVVSALIGTGEFDMDGEAKAIRRVITSPDLLTAYTNPMGRRYNLDRPDREVVRQAARTMLEHAPIGLILSMPDDDNENWRTLIDTAATEYADEINPNMLSLIAQAEGNNQAKTILGERLGKDTLSGTDENQTPTASPGTGGTYGFNLRLLGRLKADVDYFLGPSHAEKYLWAGGVDAQIAKLREIDGSIRPEDRPEWFTTEWIDQAEQAMGMPADGGIEDALDAALSGQYAAFENAIIGYIDAYDPDAGTRENGASQFAGYEVTDRVGNGAPTSYRLDWFDDEGLVHEGPKVTVKELTRMREGIFDSPDSWDSFGTTPSTSAAASDEKEPEPVESNGPQIVFASLSSDRGMPEGAVNLLDDDAAQQVSDILSDAGKTTEARNDPSDNEREQRRGNINRLLDVLPVTMVTNDGSHRVDSDEIMAATDRTERHDATAVETESDETSVSLDPEPDSTKGKGASEDEDVMASKDAPESKGLEEPARPTVAATIEAEQLAFDFNDMPDELDVPRKQEENISQAKLDKVSNLSSSHETEENDARKETTRNDGQVLPLPGGQEDEVPVHGGASAGTAQGAQEAGDAGVGRLHGPGPEGLRPDDHRVRQPLGQDAPAPQAAGQLGPVVQGTQDGGASGRGDRHQERGRSPLTHIDRGLLDPDLQATGSSLERARANVRAIEVLRDLDDSGREPTDDDIRALAAYAGWGGAQKAFEEDGADPAWSEINTRLSELLTDAEYADARSSTLTAFYTPRPVVDAMWQALGKAGFGKDPKHPDMVLEPGCGTGNFIRSTPAGSFYGFTGIEADPFSAGIARHLCADDDIINNRMERTGLPTDAFDLAVGNVPYSDAIRIDGTVIHDWFIQHSLDAVRPGGLVAVLTSRYTLDKNTSNMRRGLARKAELVAACRLPRETFDRQAGTEVVSDILILRKRDEPLAEVDAAWTDTTEFRDGVNANRLFVEHPEYVAGTMAIGSGPFGPQIDVTGTGDITRLGEQVERILTGQLEQHGIDLHDRLGERANEPIVVPDKTQQAAMRYMVDANDHIWYGDMNGQIVPAHSRVAKGGDRRMASMLRLRDQAERLLAVERDPDTTDDAVAQGIRELDEAYDRFTASYGRLNSKENLRVFDPNNSDPSLNQLYTLEKTGSDGFESKGDMLSKRVVTPMPPMPEHVGEPVEALAVSLDRVGHVDLDLIGHLLGTRDDLETVARLGDLIVTDPDDGTPMPADEYLSGDVGGELDHVDGLLRAMVDEPEQERVRAWLAENGIQAITPPSRVESCRRELIQAGAWQSATDPIHANKSVVEAPWFSNEFKEYGRGQRRAFACMFLDDCKPGVELLDKNWNAQQPKGNSLFYEVFDSGWSSDDDGTSNSAMRMLYKAATADPEAIDDRTVATILNTSGFKHGPVQDALRKITDPSLWKVEDHGYYREAKCDYLALAKELRAHPETCEYLYAADADRLAHPTVEKRYGRYNSWNQKTFKPLDEVVDMEGLEQWRDRRATWMRDHPAEPADMDRLKSLQRLRGRLEQSMPVRLTHNDITAKLGSAWIPTGVIRDFMIETFGLETQPDITDGGMRSLSVSHDETTGNWQVNASLASKLDEETIRKYGLGIGAGRNPFEVVSGALNATTSNLTKPDPDDPTGKRRVRDAQATALLYQKRHTVEQAFTEWVWTDPARTRMLEDVYNTRFNRIHPREYDGSYLTFPGISTDIDLYDHQRNAVARILQSKEGTLVAHVVGAGKTFTGVAACHEAKRLSRATKPMIVVPNHLTEQWAKDYLTLYPDANILSMTEADGAGKGAARFWAKVAAGDWDAVIVRQDTFQRMHVSPERRERYFSRRKAEMLDSIDTAEAVGNDFSAKKLKDEIGKMEKNLNRTVKQAERDRMRVDGKLQALRGDGNKEWIDFEDLGVDMLFIDEAHQYKNLAIATTISVPGVDVAAAQKCEDLFDKCEYLRETGHGSNIVFATGTPVSNSMAELYNMQRYLAPDLLRAQGVAAFTSWANTYGSIVESVEVKPEGSGYQIKQRFAKFHNLPELMSTFHDYADLLTADKLDLDVPDCDVISVAVEATEAQKQAVDALVQRAELVRDGAVDPSDDNMLNITNDGRKVSLDPKLLDVADPDIQPMEGGKVQVCAEKIHEIWQEHAAEKATQLVFCDSSTTASGKWNIQSDLKRRLIDLGIPEDEIMFAAQEKDPQKKQALFEKVRKGEVRVLIGSTGTLGTGTNVQDRLFAIHDLDCPWKPAELEQRQGRVRRQGNMFDKAQDYRYVTVGTFDSYMFQTVERKARFISQIMSSGSPSREASDVDSTVLSLADMKAIATGDPNIAKRMELENQLTQMKLLKRAHADQQRSIRFRIDMQLQPTVDNLERLHGDAVDDEPKFHKAVEIRDQHLVQGVCGLDLGDGPIADRKQAIHDLVGIAHRLDHGQTMEVGEYCGLTVMVASKNMAVKGINAFRPFVGLKGEHEHWAGTSVPDINNSADNVIRQLDRIIANNADTAQGLRVRLDNAKANLESAWNALNTPWEGQQEYDDLTDQIAKMNLEIKNGQDTAPAGEDEHDTQADLAEAQAASVTVGFDPSEPSAFPTAAETTDVPMPDPCIDPSDDVSAGPGIGM
ncbi:LPD11 domain-containing protein [Bifidobacterium pseudocatenulatum]|uniref:LPD11 domain-containing protein n=1 Tax=Bifidobacterium pseudocatenulatum TaxID=28026 RepID=UPI001CFD5BBD|nr:LPD11 domain-containing protein [Bifidobacterium pseudocatenulatum]MCB4911619.1 DEAD/DEAH box helicase family protein [Bifidobacterium pseudocatenulatum]